LTDNNGVSLGYFVPRCASLESFSAFTTCGKEVRLNDLAPLTSIRLQTSNTEYLITLLDPKTGRIQIRGGRFHATPTEAVLWGASFGGAILKTGLIAIGLRLEMAYQTVEGRTVRLLTSPVDHLFIEGHTPGPTIDCDPA